MSLSSDVFSHWANPRCYGYDPYLFGNWAMNAELEILQGQPLMVATNAQAANWCEYHFYLVQ